MADVKISQLPQASLPLSGSEIFPLVQNGVTVQAPVGNVGTVSTISALRGVTPTANASVYVEGYRTIGDNGAGNFYAVTGAATGTYIDNGGTIIVPTGGDGSSAWLRNVDGALYVDYFGAVGNGVADDTAAIQAAINSISGYQGAVALGSNKKYRITSSLVLLRGRSIYGDGTPEIIADFSSANWAGDYVAIKFLVDRRPTVAELEGAYGPKSYGFCVTGLNANLVIATAMKFYASFTMSVTEAVNCSYYEGTIRDVTVRKFDLAFDMREVWNSVFSNINVQYCRQAVKINGKCVNVEFINLQASGSTNANTSSTANRIGVEVSATQNYSGGATGRPEGLAFTDGLIYGHHNNFLLNSVLFCTITDMVLDAAINECVYIGGADGLIIKGCYLYSISNLASIVYFVGVSTALGASIKTQIINNVFTSSGSVTNYGITFQNAGFARQGLIISENQGVGLYYFVNAALIPELSVISNNTCSTHIGPRMIVGTVGGAGTVINGNMCSTANVVPVFLHPTLTSPRLIIGDNKSLTYATYYTGTVTLTAGATTVNMPNNFYDATSGLTYVSPITLANPRTDAVTRWWVTEPTGAASSSIFHLTTPLAADLKISYVVTAIPTSAA